MQQQHTLERLGSQTHKYDLPAVFTRVFMQAKEAESRQHMLLPYCSAALRGNCGV